MSENGTRNYGLGAAVDGLRQTVKSVLVGKEAVLEQLLVAVVAGGHALLEDVPGVGKTLLARTLAAGMGCSFRRIQFTPDVLPSDVTGSVVYNQGAAKFEFRPGPVFTQILLADEINRATPRTQSALLEAMEEGQVSVDGVAHPLPLPFIVLATQNPLELEGTFPLPEAQLDRFMMRIVMGYPTLAEERAILDRFDGDDPLERVGPVIGPEELSILQRTLYTIRVAEPVRDYLLSIVRGTRTDAAVYLGASPRASLALCRAAQARALLHDRPFVVPEDVKLLAEPVIGHRLIISPAARLRGESTGTVLRRVLEEVPVPVEDEALG